MDKNEIKIAEEKEFLDEFLQTKVGKNWFNENNIIKIKEATKISKIGITSICDKTFKSFTFSPKIAIDNALAKPNKVIIPIKANDITIKKII